MLWSTRLPWWSWGISIPRCFWERFFGLRSPMKFWILARSTLANFLYFWPRFLKIRLDSTQLIRLDFEGFEETWRVKDLQSAVFELCAVLWELILFNWSKLKLFSWSQLCSVSLGISSLIKMNKFFITIVESLSTIIALWWKPFLMLIETLHQNLRWLLRSE